MAHFSLDHVNDMCMDALKELGSIGAGNATTALASMLNVEIEMQVPHPEVMDASKLCEAICPEEEVIVGILTETSNDVSGSIMFLMQMDSAHYLVNRMMGKDIDNEDPFTDIELSAIKEIGNIIIGSYLSALSGMTRLTIQPSIPYISVDMAAAILSVPAVQFGQYGNNALLIETEFGSKTGTRSISGSFILMPEEESYEKILKAIGIPL